MDKEKAISDTSTLNAAIADAIEKLNSEVVFVEDISSVVELATGNIMSVNNFIHANYANLGCLSSSQGKSRRISFAKEFMEAPDRNSIKHITYAPGQPRIFGDSFNSWQGWGCSPIQGDPSPFERIICRLMPDAPAEFLLWFFSWLAYPIQHPGTKMKTAVVLTGGEGIGKSVIGYTMKRIYGANFSKVDPTSLASIYNHWIANKQFVLCEEVSQANRREMADYLKDLITGELVTVNKKYSPQYDIPNCANFLFTSNHDLALAMAHDDRRFAVWKSSAPKWSSSEADDYFYWLDNGGDSALFHSLLNLHIPPSFSPHGNAPLTLAKEHIIDSSLSGIERWCLDLSLANGSLKALDPKFPLSADEPSIVQSSLIRDAFLAVRGDRVSDTSAGNAMAKYFPRANNGRYINASKGTASGRYFVIKELLNYNDHGACVAKINQEKAGCSQYIIGLAKRLNPVKSDT